MIIFFAISLNIDGFWVPITYVFVEKYENSFSIAHPYLQDTLVFLPLVTVTPYRIVLMDALRTVKFSVHSCPFACVSCPFLVQGMRSMSGGIHVVWFYPLASFGHVQNLEQVPPDKDVGWMNVTHAYVISLSSYCVICPVLVLSASCRYPACIRWCPFDLSCERSTTGHVTEFPGWVLHVHYVNVNERFVCFLYGIPFVSYAFVTCTLVDRFFVGYLAGTYALLTTSAMTFTTTEKTSTTG